MSGSAGVDPAPSGGIPCGAYGQRSMFPLLHFKAKRFESRINTKRTRVNHAQVLLARLNRRSVRDLADPKRLILFLNRQSTSDGKFRGADAHVMDNVLLLLFGRVQRNILFFTHRASLQTVLLLLSYHISQFLYKNIAAGRFSRALGTESRIAPMHRLFKRLSRHHESDFLPVELPARMNANHAPLEHDADAVAQGEHLVQLVGEEHDGAAFLALL